MFVVSSIESGIPCPPRKHGSVGKYAFASMQMGDSFFTTPVDHQLLTKIGRYKRAHPGTQFTLRTVTESGQEGQRVWRLK